MVKKLISLASAALILSATPAAARDWGTVGGWYVTSGNNSCGMYDGNRGGNGTEIVILKRLDGNIYLQANNATWPIPRGSEADSFISIDGKRYNGLVNLAPLADSAGGGLLAVFEQSFEDELRKGEMLSLVADGRNLTNFSLSGSSAALATIQSCLDDLRSGNNVSTKANSTSAGFAALGTPAKPKGVASEWIQASDYPRDAGAAEGTTRFRLAVGADGRVSGCTIIESSGNVRLDAATCQAMTRRARFEPATDANGNNVASDYANKVVWKKPL